MMIIHNKIYKKTGYKQDITIFLFKKSFILLVTYKTY
jgi:hypothetical protein